MSAGVLDDVYLLENQASFSILCETDMFHRNPWSWIFLKVNFRSQMLSHCKGIADALYTFVKYNLYMLQGWWKVVAWEIWLQSWVPGCEETRWRGFSFKYVLGIMPKAWMSLDEMSCVLARLRRFAQLHWSVSMSDVVGNSACSSHLPLLRTLDHYENSHEEIAWNRCFWHSYLALD